MDLQAKTHADWFFGANSEIEWGRSFVARHGEQSIEAYTPMMLQDPKGPHRIEAIFFAAAEVVIKTKPEFSEYIHSGVITKLANFLARLGAASTSKADSPFLGEEVSASLFSYWALAHHVATGRRVYQILPGLAERLRHTELRGLDTSDLRLPFSTIYLLVPKAAGLQVWNRDTGAHALEGIYVFECKSEIERAWRFLLIGEAKDRKSDLYRDDALFFFTLPLPEGLSLDAAVAAMMEKFPVGAKTGGNDWKADFDFVLNVVQYITSASARTEEFIQNKEGRDLLDRMAVLPKNSQKREDLRARLKALDLKRRILVGVGVPSLTADSGPGRHWKLNVRLLVAGHWKRQPHGPKLQLRKTIWIEPYWKGEDSAAVVDGGVHVVA